MVLMFGGVALLRFLSPNMGHSFRYPTYNL